MASRSELLPCDNCRELAHLCMAALPENGCISSGYLPISND